MSPATGSRGILSARPRGTSGERRADGRRGFPGSLGPPAATALLPLLLLLPVALGAASPAGDDPEAALRAGNRLFRRGDLEAAYDAYRAGYRGTDPVLAYNLGTTAHHLGRLPEAVLWYRRAEAADGAGDDPWLAQNLESARRRLAAPRHPPPVVWGWLQRRGGALGVAAVVLAWLALGLLLADRRRSFRWAAGRRGGGALAVLALLCWTAAWLPSAAGPRPLVFLEACPGDGGGLPAGSEAWGRREGESYLVRLPGGGRLDCPRASVGEVAGAAGG